MLEDLESTIESYIGRAPLFTRLFFGYEIKAMQQSLEESRRLRDAYEPTEKWYSGFGHNFNRGYNALYNAVDRGYAAYDAISSIPVIGKPICSMIANYIGGLFGRQAKPIQAQEIQIPNTIHIPNKSTTMNMLDSVHTVSIETICGHYEIAAGKPAQSLRQKISYKPQPYITDPSPLRGSIISAISSIGKFFGEMFGESYVRSGC